jgi:NodT family efflux transporter outer membrane factor (OMF) lipoprotein
MVRRSIPPVLFLLALTGCTLGPNFEKPTSPDLPAHFDGHDAADTAAAAPDAWWGLFNDSELAKLEQRAVGANLDIQVAAHHLAQARLEVGIAKADLLPQAEGNANVTREAQSAQGVVSLLGGSGSQATAFNGKGGTTTGVPSSPASPLTQPIDLYQYGFDASWEIDLWGRVQRGIEATEAAADVSAEQEHDVLITVQAELARDYLQLRGIQADIALLDQRLAALSQRVDLMQLRARRGLATAQAVADERGQLSGLAAQLPDLTAQETRAMNAIALLLTEPPAALRDELAVGAILPPVPPSLPVGLPSDLARRRPDIRLAEAQLHAATAEIGVAVADFYPRLTLSGSAAIQALQPHELDEWSARTFGFGPGISLPIFEGGRLARRLELRKDEQQEAALRYRHTVLSALHEVDNALSDLASAQRRQDRLDQAAHDAQTSLDLVRARFNAGIDDRLAVLDAQSRQLTARQASADSQAARATLVVQLYKSLGGGWGGAADQR